MQLMRSRANFRRELKNVYCVFAAPFVSESAREICKDAGFGYLDLTGNCFISFDHIFIERFGFEKEAESRQLRSVFNEKASRIIRRLLTDPARPWSVQDLAKNAGVSTGLVSQVKTKLLDSEILQRRGEMFGISKPIDLLKQWAEAYRFEKNQAVEFYTPRRLADVELQIAEFCSSHQMNWGFTLATGAKLIGTQYVTQVNRIHVYTDTDLLALADALDLKRVESGGNVVLMQPFDQDILFNRQLKHGMYSVSDIQLYLDFFAQRGRLQETADVIFDTRLRPVLEAI